MHLFCLLVGRIKESQAAETYSTFTGSGNEQTENIAMAPRRESKVN
jgi:hypothetical protein